eukprot:scaffold5190_cov113-Isochrysis_galbana.AAC.2
MAARPRQQACLPYGASVRVLGGKGTKAQSRAADAPAQRDVMQRAAASPLISAEESRSLPAAPSQR